MRSAQRCREHRNPLAQALGRGAEGGLFARGARGNQPREADRGRGRAALARGSRHRDPEALRHLRDHLVQFVEPGAILSQTNPGLQPDRSFARDLLHGVRTTITLLDAQEHVVDHRFLEFGERRIALVRDDLEDVLRSERPLVPELQRVEAVR
jgi:hypothetical protein